MKDHETTNVKQQPSSSEHDNNHNDDDDDNDGNDSKESTTSSEESEDDDLVLEGVLVRNPDASSTSDDDDDDEEEEEADEDLNDDERSDEKPSASSASNPSNSGEKRSREHDALVAQTKQRKKRKQREDDDDTIQVEFTFCDMNERFFHGIKNLLHNSSTVFHRHSSSLTDQIIENISVGTVVSTADDSEGNVFGFASVLSLTKHQTSEAINYFNEMCLKNCPPEHRTELETALSGKTKRPAGYLIHGRMINLPLEIVEELHKQLILDMDWAVENAEGGEDERKSLDFGAFILLAPCQKDQNTFLYRYFDDEIFAAQAEFVFTMNAPKSYSKEDKEFINVIVMTKTGHRAAMQDLAAMIHGAASS